MDRPDELRLAPELHISPRPVGIVLAVLGIVATNAGEFLPERPIGVVVGLTLIAAGLFIWSSSARWPRLAAWLAVGAPILLVLSLWAWLRVPSVLSLLAIPAALAVALISFPAALTVAASETAILLLMLVPGGPYSNVAMTDGVVALAALWGTMAAVYGLYQPTQQFNQWLTQYSVRTQQAVAEVQARRAEVEQMLAELAHVNRQLALANDRMVMLRTIAEEAQKSKAAFVAKVSHEFRTPLNMIIGLIDLLVETPEVYGEALPPPLFEDLKIVHRNCEHLSSMVNDVLDLSQAEAGRLALRQERVSLAGIIDDAVTVVGSLVERKGLSLVIDVPPDLPLVYCDPTRIRQVVLNLVSNAARFTERGSITIRAAHQDEWVTVSVIDTGPGITPEDATRIFEPFCQGMRNPWRDQGGSGLGLTISKQFIELHGGRIWLESQPGQGATFAFRIPISSPLEPVASPGRWISEEFRWVERTSRPTLQPAPFRPRVVVCDETGELVPALGRWAEQAELVETRSLPQAAEDLRQYPAHVLLVNAVSPDRLWSLADEAHRVAPDLPIVTCCVPPRLDRARAAGASDYLVRPVTQAQLWAAIRSLGKPIHRILVVDDDPDVRQLLRRMLLTGPGGKSDQKPMEVDTAADGEEALASLRSNPPDLVLLDVVLPGMDGWQVLAQKSQDATLRDIPIIMVSAQDRAEQQLRSEAFLATLGEGMSIRHLLQCTLGVSATLFSPA